MLPFSRSSVSVLSVPTIKEDHLGEAFYHRVGRGCSPRTGEAWRCAVYAVQSPWLRRPGRNRRGRSPPGKTIKGYPRNVVHLKPDESPNARLFAHHFLCQSVAEPAADPSGTDAGLSFQLGGPARSARKRHTGDVPVAGGLPILFSTCFAFGLLLFCSEPLRELCPGQAFHLFGWFSAAAVICAVGSADDFGCLRGRHKLLGQCVAVAIVLFSGFQVSRLTVFDFTIELGLLSLPFTAFLLLGAINSFNLLDGMDGLLCSLSSIILLALCGVALSDDQGLAAYLALALGGALLGFLFFNFPPASIFLGDSGSMLLGLVIGVLTIQCCSKDQRRFRWSRRQRYSFFPSSIRLPPSCAAS